ncbi:hypothetical protein V493_07240 [Pseudogymnoascus sp. VKM F-4281 (FW-2241)]|nr:hypothetical protein V493_07240 [Pseudogymnoascus sp. VKM F-4281 (FW-2241)]
MDSTSGHRNTNPPLFSRASASPFNWDQFNHDGPSDSGQFRIQMSYPSQPAAGDSIIVRTVGVNSLKAAYNSAPSGIPEQRTLQKWQRTPSNPPQVSVGVSSSIPYTHTLASYVFNNEDPWSPKVFSPGPSTFDSRLQPKSQAHGLLPVSQNPYGNRFQAERGPIGGVILGKPQSDSGYGSLQSAYASSISNFDTGLPGKGNQIAFPGSHGFQPRFEPRVASSEVPLPVPPLLRCPTCRKAVKTPSALRKHDQRHRKPFICPHIGCLGSGNGQGFGTINDLERHIGSKHRKGEVFGRPNQVFSCHFSECRDRGRTFTRSDNFGVHLNRCHGMNKDEIKGIIQRKKEQHRFGAPRIQLSDRPRGSPGIPTQDTSQEISFDANHAMEQGNESLVADESHYEMYDYDERGPDPEDMTFISADQNRDLEDEATNMPSETTHRPADTMSMEYFTGIGPIDTLEPVDFILDPILDISESATPVATTIGIAPKRERERELNIHAYSTDPHAQKALASALASKRSQDLKKSKGMAASQMPFAPKEDPVDRTDTSTLFNRNKPSRKSFRPRDSIKTDSNDEDCNTDSQDDDSAATILRTMKSQGFVIQMNPALLLEHPAPNSPTSSVPTKPQSALSCTVCFKTCNLPSQMAAIRARTLAPSPPTFYCGFCARAIRQDSWSGRFDHLDAHFAGRGTVAVEMAAWTAEGDTAKGEGQAYAAEGVEGAEAEGAE